MSWNYSYTPTIWPSAFTFLLLVALFVYAWRRPSVPGTLPFSVACLFAALWAAGSMMENAAVDLPIKIFWIKFQAAWQLPVVTAVTCFVLEYTWPGRWLTRRNLALLSVPPILILFVILTDDQYHLAWRGFTFVESIQPQFSVAGWVAFAYAFGVLGTLNLIALVWLMLRAPQHRWPLILMLIGQFGGRILFMLERTGRIHSALSVDLLGMSFEFSMYALALFGFRIFDPIPIAHQTAIEQIQYGMLVLDSQDKILNLNPAAGVILGAPVRRLLGRPIQDLLPDWVGIHRDVQISSTDPVELKLGTGPNLREYQVDVSTLRDWHGMAVGSLLMLRDVTDQKKAQAQILEQQRALATLHEREQLARELHDNLGQVLGYASLKMSAARKLMADGRLAKADEQMARLESSLTEAHADVREYILNLRATPATEKPFFLALQHYLDGFRQNYGIQVDVCVDPGLGEDVFAPEAQTQLFRILQEALSNARKHAATNHVKVSFGMEDGRVRMCVQDNGKGFDPLQAAGAGSGHFGLSIMRERAESLGGSLRVQSAPAEGTCVEVEVPVRGKVEAK